MHRTMKKWISALLILGLLLSISACGKKAEVVETAPPTTAATEATVVVEEITEATEAPTEPTEKHYTLSFAGDCTLGVMPAHEYTLGGFTHVVGDNYDYPFQNVRQYFENDEFTIVNFEGTLGYEGSPTPKAFNFRGPAEYTQILTGSSVEAVTLANNHSMDYGQEGYDETKRILTEAGVPFVEKDSSNLITTANGLKIGLYAAAFVIDQKDLEAEVAALREQGAEIVIFAIHWGSEGTYHSFSDQWKQAYKAIDAGVDIVYGHHPHVLQKIEEYNGGYIFYSLGNFSFGGNQAPLDMDTALLQLDVIRDLDGNVSLGELTIIPCCISSISGSNNYQPTPYREGTDGYQRVLEKLQGKWTGTIGASIYSQADDLTTPGEPVTPPAEEAPEATAPTAPTVPVTPPAGGGNGGSEDPDPEGGSGSAPTVPPAGGESGGGETGGGEGGGESGGEAPAVPVPPAGGETGGEE